MVKYFVFSVKFILFIRKLINFENVEKNKKNKNYNSKQTKKKLFNFEKKNADIVKHLTVFTINSYKHSEYVCINIILYIKKKKYEISVCSCV